MTSSHSQDVCNCTRTPKRPHLYRVCASWLNFSNEDCPLRTGQSPARSPLGCSSCSPRIFFNLDGRCDSLFSAPSQPHSRTPNTKRKLSVYICISNQLARTKDFQRTESNSYPSHFLGVFLLLVFCCLVAKLCQTLCNPMGRSPPGSRQAPLSVGLPRQEYRSALPCPPPGHPPDSMSPAWAGGAEPPGKSQYCFWVTKKEKQSFHALKFTTVRVWKRSVKG